MAHLGKYLLCRTVVVPFILRAVSTVVQGISGPQRRLSVYNLATDKVPGASADVGAHCLPKGTVIAIKEPYFKKGALDNQYFIRVDTPMDVVVIDDPDHPLVAGTPWSRVVADSPNVKRAPAKPSRGTPPPEAPEPGSVDALGELAHWHDQGNRLYGLEQYVEALYAYQRGLQLLAPLLAEGPPELQIAPPVDKGAQGAGRSTAGPVAPAAGGEAHAAGAGQGRPQLEAKRTILLNNCAAACLGYEDYSAALGYADAVLGAQAGDAKALMRRSKALEGLGRYVEAVAAWEALMAASQPQQHPPSSGASASAASAASAAGTASRQLQRLRQRAREARQGEYDEAGMLREAAASAAPRLERADFIGPVAVADLDARADEEAAAAAAAAAAAGVAEMGLEEGAKATPCPGPAPTPRPSRRGRGLLTTSPVRAGQLLLAVKADAVVYFSEVQSAMPAISGPGVLTGPTHAQLVRELVPAVLGGGRTAHRLAHLHGGRRAGGAPPVPTAACGYAPTWEGARAGEPAAGGAGQEEEGRLAQRVGGWGDGAAAGGRGGAGAGWAAEDWPVRRGLIRVHSDSSGAASAGHGKDAAVPCSCATVDEQVLWDIVDKNVFGSDPLPAIPVLAYVDDGDGRPAEPHLHETLPSASGLWSLPSYINHACVGSANRYFLGDFMFVRATRDLPAGAEVTFGYKDSLEPGDSRAAALRQYGFACDCELCVEDEAWGREQDMARMSAWWCRAMPGRYARCCNCRGTPCHRITGAQCSSREHREYTQGLGSAGRPAIRTTLSARTVASLTARWRELRDPAALPGSLVPGYPLAAALERLLRGAEAALGGRLWRTALLDPASALGHALMSAGDAEGAAAAYERAFLSLHRAGPDVDPAAPDAPCVGSLGAKVALHVALMWSMADGREGRQKARHWEGVARAKWRVFLGSEALFEERFAGALGLLRGAEAG